MSKEMYTTYKIGRVYHVIDQFEIAVGFASEDEAEAVNMCRSIQRVYERGRKDGARDAAARAEVVAQGLTARAVAGGEASSGTAGVVRPHETVMERGEIATICEVLTTVVEILHAESAIRADCSSLCERMRALTAVEAAEEKATPAPMGDMCRCRDCETIRAGFMPPLGYQCKGCGHSFADPIPTVYMSKGKCERCDKPTCGTCGGTKKAKCRCRDGLMTLHSRHVETCDKCDGTKYVPCPACSTAEGGDVAAAAGVVTTPGAVANAPSHVDVSVGGQRYLVPRAVADCIVELRSRVPGSAHRKIDAAPDANVERVRVSLLERSRRGQAKYGTTTERTDIDLLGWFNHLQEELLDAAVYVERLKTGAAGALTPSKGVDHASV